MEVENLLKAIEKTLKKSGEEFSSFLWRERMGEALETQKRFSRLVEWINRELETSGCVACIDAPMNRESEYTKGKLADYVEAVQKVGVLVHCRELLTDERTSKEQRENIEYTLGKLYGVHYNEYLESYV